MSKEGSIEVFAPSFSKQKSSSIKKISFFLGYRESLSNRYRVYNIIEGLKSRGAECCVFDEKISQKELKKLLTSDVVIFFKAVMSERLSTIIDTFKKSDVPTVFDLDDLFFDVAFINLLEATRNWTDAKKCEFVKGYRDVLKRCDFATTTTDCLASVVRAIPKTTFVIPNTINKAQYKLAEKIWRGHTDKSKINKIAVRIGYFSGTTTHNSDFLEVSEALYELLGRHENIEFHLVGYLELPVKFDRFDNRIVKKPFMSYIDMLKYLSKMDINIAPLEKNIFNDSKSELKIFEAGLVGVPTIASRTDSYQRCISDAMNGYLASSKNEWLEKLSLLVKNEKLRTTMGARARKDFIKRFYIENTADNIIKIYEKIVDIYQKRKPDLSQPDKALMITEPLKKAGQPKSMTLNYEETVEFYKDMAVTPVGIPKDKAPKRANINMNDAELVAFYSQRYADVDVAAFLMKERKERLYGLCNMVKAREFYLDVGCANGGHMEILHQKGIRGIGLDLSIPNILRGRQKYPHLKFIHGFAENIPFKDNFFDIVLLGDVIEHFRNPKATLAECLRVAVNGIAICVPIKEEITPEHINPFNYEKVLHLLRFYRLKAEFYDCEGKRISDAEARSKLDTFPWLLVRAEKTARTNAKTKEMVAMCKNIECRLKRDQHTAK